MRNASPSNVVLLIARPTDEWYMMSKAVGFSGSCSSELTPHGSG